MGLEEARLRAKLTQAALAEIAGVARSTINKIEKGQAPRPDTALRLEQALTSRLMATGRIELVLPHKNTSLPPANGKSAAPTPANGKSAAPRVRPAEEGWTTLSDALLERIGTDSPDGAQPEHRRSTRRRRRNMGP